MARPACALTLCVALLFGACADGDEPWEEAADERAARARQVALDAGLPDDVADVVATLAHTVEATYRVTYDALDANGTASTVTVTQQPPNRRIDVVAPDRPDLTTIVTAEESFTCVRAGGEWRCAPGDEPVEIGTLAEADAVATTEALAKSTDDFRFEVVSEVLTGVEARCLVVEGTGALSEATARLCVAPDGPPLVVERASGSLTATSYTTEVTDDAFQLPVEPVEPVEPPPSPGSRDGRE